MRINAMKLTSHAFLDGGSIPKEFSMYGENRIPPLHVEFVPKAAKSLALIVDDPDAPNGTFTHWLLFNVDPRKPDLHAVAAEAQQGINNFGKVEYGGPKPPSGKHRYFFASSGMFWEFFIGRDKGLILRSGRKYRS
jgi:hypothetical protein